MSNIQQRNYETCKEITNYDPYLQQEGKGEVVYGNYIWGNPAVGFSRQRLTSGINIFKEWKETRIKGKYDDNDSANRESQWRDTNYKKN